MKIKAAKESSQNKRSARNKMISRVGIMTAVLIICSQISIPLSGSVPLSLQTFAIALIAWLLPPAQAFYSLLSYLLLGAAGLPVFAGFQGGFSRLVGPTGGFLLGFIPMDLLLTLAVRLQLINRSKSRTQSTQSGGKKQFKKRASRFFNLLLASLISLTGLACCHLLGVLWLARQADISLRVAATTGSLPFILKDILSLLGAALLAGLLRKRLAAVSGKSDCL